jgi:hypothetical protein
VSSWRTVCRAAMLVLVIGGAVVANAPPAAAAGSITAFTLDSEPGDYIGQGQTFTFTSENATITAATLPDGGVELAAVQGANVHRFDADIAPPLGGTLTPGTTYPTARAATDASTAGLDVYGDGRGCNMANGSLHLIELTLGGGGTTIASFAATYENHCEDGSAPALFGELRYQSSENFRADGVDPTNVDFGSQRLASSTVLPVSVTNTGNVSLALGTAVITGAEEGDYSLQTDTCSGQLVAAGASCALDVAFAPGDVGSRTASIGLSTDTARGSIQVGLSGTGFRLATAVKLTTSASKVDFKGSVTVTAHLVGFEDTTNQTVEIYATPWGGAQKLIASGDVNGSGDVSATVSMSKRTAFVATFAGDVGSEPSTSPSKNVYVYPILTTGMVGFDDTSGGYRRYHYTSRCPDAHRACPVYAIDVAPNHAGSPIDVTLQLHYRGSWHTASTTKFKLNAKSRAAIVFVYRDRGIIGIPSRVRVEFAGDADHLDRTSPWSFFEVVK